jgi:agmatine deiminase
MKRRTFIKGVTGMITLPLWSYAKSANATGFYMPDEAEPHVATWMAFGATEQAWGTSGAYGISRKLARHDLMRIAVNLSRFETVKMLVSPNDMAEAKIMLAQAKAEKDNVFSGNKNLPAIEIGGKVELIAQNVDDLWMRDIGPVFVSDQEGRQFCVNFNFNGWGQESTGVQGWARDPEKARNGIQPQPVGNDKKVADFILKYTNTPKIDTWLVLEGGGIEVDGEGTAICTESCILNINRNPNRTKAEVEAELERVIGVRKVIWLPGLKAHDITDGHIDFYARFVAPGQVVFGLDRDPESPEYDLTHAHEQILNVATDAKGRKLMITPLIAPAADKVADAVVARNGWAKRTFNTEGFAAGYIGFFAANNCILMQQFGDEAADKAALSIVQRLYPNRTVLQIAADGLANGGGTIHCSTQQQPKV